MEMFVIIITVIAGLKVAVNIQYLATGNTPELTPAIIGWRATIQIGLFVWGCVLLSV